MPKQFNHKTRVSTRQFDDRNPRPPFLGELGSERRILRHKMDRFDISRLRGMIAEKAKEFGLNRCPSYAGTDDDS